MVCCLFGHKNTPNSIYCKLEETIKYVIEHESVDYFLLGNNGYFDFMALHILRNIACEYPDVSYSVVLAYLPTTHKEDWPYSKRETVYPEGLETIHPKYAIAWRNNWMVDSSDIAISYVTHSWGGAAKYTELAKKMEIRFITWGKKLNNE